MENFNRRVRRLVTLRSASASALRGLPYPLKRCDCLGCEEIATRHCSAHGVHFCRRHFEEHQEDWHCGSSWVTASFVARA